MPPCVVYLRVVYSPVYLPGWVSLVYTSLYTPLGRYPSVYTARYTPGTHPQYRISIRPVNTFSRFTVGRSLLLEEKRPLSQLRIKPASQETSLIWQTNPLQKAP